MKSYCLFLALLVHPACAPSHPAAPEPPTAVPPSAAATQPETRDPKPGTDLYGDPLPPGAIARMGTVRLRHESAVLSVAFSPDGKTLASGSADNTIRLWEVATGKELLKLEGHEQFVMSVAFSPDGKTLASGSMDKTIRFWDVATGKKLMKVEGHKETVNSVVYSPGGSTLASGSDDETIRLWDAASGKELHKFEGHDSLVLSVVFSPDGKTLASVSSDNTLRLWESASGKELIKIAGEDDGCFLSVAFSPNGKVLASGRGDKTIRLFDAATGKELLKLEGHEKLVPSVAFSPDAKTLASGSFDQTIRLWDLATGKELLIIDKHKKKMQSVAFSPDGKTLASGGWDGTVDLWESATGKGVVNHEEFFADVFTPDEKTLITVSRRDSMICRCEATTGRIIQRLEVPVGETSCVAFSPDWKTLAHGDDNGTIHLRDANTGRILQELKGHEGGAPALAFSPNGTTLATGGEDKTIRLWELPTGRELFRFEGRGGEFNSVAFSPDGKTLATLDSDAKIHPLLDGKILGMEDPTSALHLWNTATGKELRAVNVKIEWESVKNVAFSPDGKVLVLNYSQRIRLWDVAAMKELLTCNDVYAFAFSPDGKMLAVGGSKGTIRLLDMATGEGICEWEGHSGIVISISFSPSGKRIYSGHSNATVLAWDIAALFPRGSDEPLSRDSLWNDLGCTDAGRAYATIMKLSQGGDDVLPSMKTRLKMIPIEDVTKRVRKALENLDQDDIDVRNKAEEELLSLGDAAEPMIQASVAETRSDEVKTRVGRVLEALRRPLPLPPGEPLRRWRAMQVLEQIGSKEAKDVLAMLEKESPSLRERREAGMALERLRRGVGFHPRPGD